MAIVTCPNCGAKNRVNESKAERLRPVCGKCGRELDVASAPSGASAADIGHPVTLTDASFDDFVAGSAAKPVLVDAWAPWCGPCRALAPVLDQLAAESGGRYVIGKLNVDDNPAVANRYQIEGIPTMLLFKGGKLVDRIVGLAPKQTIQAKLSQHS